MVRRGDVLKEDIFQVNGYMLDSQQQDIVLDESDALLVIAGAGSGKTLTIVGKVRYLTMVRKLKEENILCISFTNDAVKSLQNSLQKNGCKNVTVKTFHKLALDLLRGMDSYITIAKSDALDVFVHEWFHGMIFEKDLWMQWVLNYFFPYKVRKRILWNYQKLLKKREKELLRFEKLLIKFLHLFKAHAYGSDDFLRMLQQASCQKGKRVKIQHQLFLLIASTISCLYQQELEANKQVDFDDMIFLATKYLKEGKMLLNYQYVIVDEYQDTSYTRMLFVQEILKTCGAKFMAVGDDFQSIYRFTGCDLDIFLNFDRYFPNATYRMIENTYRNSQELIQVAGDFIMKNKAQLKKHLVSKKHCQKPIKLYTYRTLASIFSKVVDDIYELNKGPIFVLGRNYRDIEEIDRKRFLLQCDGTLLDQEHPTLKIRYFTVHCSKGLEEENVIVINMKDDILGFPTKMKEDALLRYLSCWEDTYKDSEERRLFYVALTRSKGFVYLLVPKRNPSYFVLELKKNSSSFLESKRNFFFK